MEEDGRNPFAHRYEMMVMKFHREVMDAKLSLT